MIEFSRALAEAVGADRAALAAVQGIAALAGPELTRARCEFVRAAFAADQQQFRRLVAATLEALCPSSQS